MRYAGELGENTQDYLAGNRWKCTSMNTEELKREWSAGQEMGRETQVRGMSRLHGKWEWQDLKQQGN